MPLLFFYLIWGKGVEINTCYTFCMVRNINQEHKDNLTLLDKIAVKITAVVGTMWCAMAFTALALISLPAAIHGGVPTTVSWIAQTFLQLVLLSIIMVGQNLQSKHSELRAEADYETNIESKKDIELIIEKLSSIENDKLDKILEAVKK